MTAPGDSTFLALNSSIYAQGSAPWPSGWQPLTDSTGAVVSQEKDNDGFFAEAFINSTTHQVAIVYEGTSPSQVLAGTALGKGMESADKAIFNGQTPAAYADALSFASTVQTAATANGISDIYVTGHSLGGGEASWVAENSTFGGAAYGAPGVALTGSNPTNANFTSYGAWGDPVAAFAPPGTGFVGNHQMVGDPSNAINAAIAKDVFRLAYDAAKYHPVKNYIDNLVPPAVKSERDAAHVASPSYDPLVFNLTGAGLASTTSIQQGVFFDTANNGFMQATAWVGTSSGILVNDPTGGAITNGSQLFGTSTSLSGGGYAVDGFAALADLDSNHDGVINSSDTAWSNLRIWVDSNVNGVTDSGELETMSAAGIASISLTTTNTNVTDANGNFHGKTASYSLTGGGTGEVDDVSLSTEPYLSVADTVVTVDGTISLLPDVVGSGTLPDLQQAVQIQANASDTTLKGYVQSFVSATDDATRNTLVDEIIYQWAGVQSVGTTSRGLYVDGRQLAALEQFSGTPFKDSVGSSNPTAAEGQALTVAYQQLHNEVMASLEAQTDLQSVFAGIALLFDTSSVEKYINPDQSFAAAETQILSDLSANRATGLVTLTDFNYALHALGMDTDSGFATFRSDLVAQGADVAATFLYGTPVVYGTAGDDVITAWAGNQTVIASQGGNDTLIGSGDNEVFYGSGGSDLYIGGVGNNEKFEGGSNGGVDTFVAGQGTEFFGDGWLNAGAIVSYAAGDGHLTVRDDDGEGTLVLDSSIARSDVSLAALGATITDGTGGDQVAIQLGFSTLVFADGTTVNLTTSGGTHLATTGATLTGNARPDDIYQYNSGTGHVTISDSIGNNEIWMGPGIVAGDISLTTSSNDLLITDGVSGDQITDKNHGVQTLRFDDGSTMSLLAAGNSYTLAGATTSTGTGFNDTYSFASGTGTATISDPGGVNTLKLGAGLTAASLTFTGSGNDLLITDGVSGDEIIIPGQLSSPVVQIIKFNDNSTLDLTAGLKLVEAGGQSLLNGTGGNDTLTGNSGSQTLSGNGGNDVYINGSGPTTINAGTGNDTYSYASGSGALTINETGGANTVILGSGITTGNTSLVASGHDLLITDSVSGDTITLKDQLDTQIGVQSLVFNGGTTWTLEGIALTANAGILYGTPGDDTLTATSGTETLVGNAGNDRFVGAAGTESLMGNGWDGNNTFVIGSGLTTAYGGGGNDTYSYASGDGALIINEEGGQNTIVLAAGLTAGSLTFTASGHDLLITDGTGGDTITLKNQLTNIEGVQTIEFSDTSTEALEGIALTANAASLYGTSGNDTLTATSGTETINGNGGNDIFVDASGNLTAIGGTGNDTYSYASGSGLLTIEDNAGTNTIKLGSGITTGNVSLTASGHDLLITDSVGGDTLTLKNQLSTQFGITDLVFSGGTTEILEGLALTANASVQYGTAGNDTLTATSGTQTLTGNGGNDKFVGTGGVVSMNGASGNDTFIGGAGAQVMNGGGGNDIFEGSGGNDTMNGSAGNDSFIASTGTEIMNGSGGNDVFIAGGGTASATGTTGNDLYSFASGGGALIINDDGGTDTLKLGTGLTAGNVVISESTNGHDLLITDGVGGDLITISSAVGSATTYDRIETLVYGDASTQDLTSGLKLTAQTGSSTLIASAFGGNNTLVAVASGSTETLEGGSGNDTYSYSSGDGAVYITEGGLGGTDTLKLGSGLTSANVSLSMTNGADLLIADGTGGDLITIHDQTTAAYAIETLVYGDASTMSLTSGLKISATSGTATVTGTTGNDTLTGTTGTQTLNGDGGSDTFIGGSGTQTLNGGGGSDGNNVFIDGTGATTAKGATGNDTYSYAASDGALVISETGGTDTLKLASGLTSANVVFSESTNGHDLLITDGTGGDLITITSDINFSSDRVEHLIYGDGSTLDLTSGLTLVAQTGSSTLVAIAGNNTLIAVSGANTETLEGNTGNDLYSYASGTGKVYIADQGGTDTLKLGTGLTSANVVFSESANGADLLITDGVGGDLITVQNGIRNAANQIENFIYGDGSTANLSSIVLTAGAGNTTLNGTAGNNILVGTTGNQHINGDGGADFFNGGIGTQTLNGSGNTGNNVFFAGVGTTSAEGDTGNDIYNYAAGDGALVITDQGGTDTLILGSGLTAANVVLSESTNAFDFLLTDGTGGDLITIKDAVPSSFSNFRIETLVYGDGSSLSLTGGLTLTAQTGSSTLEGISGNNTFIAVAGGATESFIGDAGNDTYSYTAGDGAVYIVEDFGTDTLLLASGLTAANVSLTETTNGHDLLITDTTGGDKIDIFDAMIGGSQYQVDKLVYGDGTSISLTGGLTLYAQTGSSTLNGLAGANTFLAVSGGSTESFLGNSGNDTYSYTAGYGAIYISEQALGGTDTLLLASGLTAANVSLSETTNGHDLLITDSTGGDRIDIFDQFSGNAAYQVEKLVYGDGTSLSLTGGLTLTAQTGSSTLTGLAGANTFIAVAGGATETFLGNSGNDTYSYTAGDGAIYISEGNLGGTDTLKLASSMTASNVFFSEASNGADLLITDTTSGDLITIKNAITTAGYKVETLVYSDASTLDLTKVIGAASAATTLNGTTGNDIMIPNTGNLTLAGKGGNDLYDFGKGMGKDVINNGVSTTNSANGTLFFGHGIGDNQLWFDEVNSGGTISPTGANLRIDIMGTTTSMTINGFFTGGSSTYEQLSEFELSDSGLKLDSQLANLVSAMATFETNYFTAHGTAFDPTAVSSISDTTVLAAVSSDWH